MSLEYQLEEMISNEVDREREMLYDELEYQNTLEEEYANHDCKMSRESSCAVCEEYFRSKN
jgi:hypothetical protein